MPSGSGYPLPYVLGLPKVDTVLVFFDTFSYICDKEISPGPDIAIFGVTTAGIAISGVQSGAIAFSSLLARCLIFCNRSQIGRLHTGAGLRM